MTQRDIFASIAAQRTTLYSGTLIEPQPPALPDITLPLTAATEPVFVPRPKLNTSAKLRRELTRQRKAYAKYLQNLAPAIEQTRITVPIQECDWRIETPEDQQDFHAVQVGSGVWERVHIPHYGPPLGRAVTYYRTTFEVSEMMLEKGAVYVCFKGVDYKAHVFVHGSYLGSHEGFFAPFEFDCTAHVQLGENVLLVKVENDAICMGNASWGEDGHLYDGDKIYAATGPGYDDPQIGWHHCPPGMGIYQSVSIEARAPIHLHDLFVRPVPEECRAEAWVEVINREVLRKEIALEISVYGQNFRKTLIHKFPYQPSPLGPGVNYFRIPLEMPDARRWELETPWLYQLQVRLLDAEGKLLDTAIRQFGMRSFRMEEDEEPKGRFYLNDREIRLRGANTMGFEQQDVMTGNIDQLIDDILLAKICHINFWRLTQRPVQQEVYDYCDRLGLMTQTDLPLFGCLRRNQFAEAVRQAGEMERLVRAHPCNILVSYINEPFGVTMEKQHRHLLREELECFFVVADHMVRLTNPDRVIKAVDGDYDPPGPSLPDNHCYTGWYHGHAIDLGKLHKGYWLHVKPGWHYGCGEFGSEGLDSLEVMRKYYPPAWLPPMGEKELSWTPHSIVKSQTSAFYSGCFDLPRSLKAWIAASQQYQAWVTRMMTEAFRRDNRMTSFAIHLFIDAFPAGWMKAIMDVDRTPKDAYFAYRESLTPLMANLRTDRLTFFAGEQIELEAWICNDLTKIPDGAELRYQIEREAHVFAAGRVAAKIPACSSQCQGFLRFTAPAVTKRTQVTVRLALCDGHGGVLHDTAQKIDVFPAVKLTPRQVKVIGGPDGPATQLAADLGLTASDGRSTPIILIDDYAAYQRQEHQILHAVEHGATALFVLLPPGQYDIAGEKITVQPSLHHFVSRATGHPLVKGFKPDDFRIWHDPRVGYITPLLQAHALGKGWQPILVNGEPQPAGDGLPSLAAAEKPYGRGILRLCHVAVPGRTAVNPVADTFARRLLGLEESLG